MHLPSAPSSVGSRMSCPAMSSRVGAKKRQVLVYQPDRHGALPHRGGAPLDRPATGVARREHPWHARLQQEWLARTFLPSLHIERRTVQFPSRQDEAAIVEFDRPSEPASVSLCADKGEESTRPEGPALARAVVFDDDPFQVLLSQEAPDLRAGEQFDVRGGHYPVDEVPRHALAQISRPYEQVDLPRTPRQV